MWPINYLNERSCLHVVLLKVLVELTYSPSDVAFQFGYAVKILRSHWLILVGEIWDVPLALLAM